MLVFSLTELQNNRRSVQKAADFIKKIILSAIAGKVDSSTNGSKLEVSNDYLARFTNSYACGKGFPHHAKQINVHRGCKQ